MGKPLPRRDKEREVVHPLHPSKKTTAHGENHTMYSQTGEKRGVENLGRKLSIIMGIFLPSAGESRLYSVLYGGSFQICAFQRLVHKEETDGIYSQCGKSVD